MAILTIPKTTFFRSANFGLEENTETFTSPISNTVQTLARTGGRWYLSITYVPMKRADAQSVLAFLTKLRGRVNSFYGYDPLATSPLGDVSASTLLVNGADQTGVSLVCDGAEVSTTVLKAGDYIEVNNELKMVTDDATSDGSGNVTINFSPSLRSSPSDNASITTTNPKCTMKLQDDSVTWSQGVDSFYNISFSGIEVF
jgi:hypothetical protein